MNDAATPPIASASVKVMRSHDYCHFEVILSTNDLGATGAPVLTQIDNLRKEAARLVDKAVEQYKIAKAAIAQKARATSSLDWLVERAEEAEKTPEHERTPEQKADIKALADANFHAGRSYDYEDDWQDDVDDDE